MAVRFRVFNKIYIDVAAANRKFNATALSTMKRIGAILRNNARKRIKRRMVTKAMLGRLSDAEKANDSARVARLKATIARRRAETSSPGQPPIAHVPDRPFASIRDIRFAADRKSVIVGPAGGNSKKLVGSNRVTVPEILEFGGTATLAEIMVGRSRDSVWVARSRRRRPAPWQKTRDRKATYAARPFMKPTLKETAPQMAKIYAKVFGGG